MVYISIDSSYIQSSGTCMRLIVVNMSGSSMGYLDKSEFSTSLFQPETLRIQLQPSPKIQSHYHLQRHSRIVLPIR
jgi:hypothetical protein